MRCIFQSLSIFDAFNQHLCFVHVQTTCNQSYRVLGPWLPLPELIYRTFQSFWPNWRHQNGRNWPFSPFRWLLTWKGHFLLSAGLVSVQNFVWPLWQAILTVGFGKYSSDPKLWPNKELIFQKFAAIESMKQCFGSFRSNFFWGECKNMRFLDLIGL